MGKKKRCAYVCVCVGGSGGVVLRVDKEITGLVLFSQLILSITDDRGDGRPC